MASRTGSKAAMHSRRGPRKLLKVILEKVALPDDVREAILDVIDYPTRYILK